MSRHLPSQTVRSFTILRAVSEVKIRVGNEIQMFVFIATVCLRSSWALWQLTTVNSPSRSVGS